MFGPDILFCSFNNINIDSIIILKIEKRAIKIQETYEVKSWRCYSKILAMLVNKE